MTHNWDAIQNETTQYLQDLIRIDTTNPPGNEVLAAEYLAGIFKRGGIEPTVLESEPGRGNIVARIKGDGRAAPLLLMVHLDVVPVEPEHWSHPPFGAEISDGYMWGRGTLDTKELAAMELMVMLMLKRENKSLVRDVIFMANADEEAGGLKGAGWMVKEHPDLIRAEYAINEGGGAGFDMLGHRFYTVQTGEKGTARFTMRMRGKPGHASQPHRDNSVVKLAQVVQKIGEADLPLHVTCTAKQFIEGVGKTLGKPIDLALNALLNPKKHRATLDNLPLDEGIRAMLYAMLHNTVTPTMLKAGTKINVIPSMAEGQCDARIIPGETPDSLLRELRPIIGKEVEIEFANGQLGRESGHETALFETIKHVMAKHEPKATVLPYLVVGATDARHVGKLGTHVYGFCPMFVPPSEMGRVHGHDERISLDNVLFGTRVLYDVVSELCANGK